MSPAAPSAASAAASAAVALSVADFAPAFQDLHGYPPFPWQQALVEQLAATNGHWPDILDLPTGSGKTAALDIALFHLALQAGRPLDDRTAPLRIALVVDRRLIVDDVFVRAQHLAQRLRQALTAPADAPLGRWARALQRLAGPDGVPVQAVRLRGGVPLERGWTQSPTQPLLISSTVDQVGSRLLFRGYGVRDRSLPLHAGLMGADSLILLDEAHLAEPFRQSLGWISHHRAPGRTPFQVAVLTATPGLKGQRPFGLSEADRTHPVLSQRLSAPKPVTLVETNAALGTEKLVEAFVKAAQDQQLALSPHRSDPAIAVVVNRVALARQVFRELAKAMPEAAVTLVIGPARPVQRATVAAALEGLKTGQRDQQGFRRDRPTVLVATQCIEAGLDLDLDGLVSQACPLDALRQRAGRLNRSGRALPAQVTIVAAREDVSGRKPDPVYGEQTRATWTLLTELSQAGGVDLGSEALTRALGERDTAAYETEKPDAPVMMPAYVDLWRQTSPRPLPDPDVPLFLHGPARELASVQVLWRADLWTQEERTLLSPEAARRLLTLAPPRATESIGLPLWTVRAWLQQKADQAAPPGADSLADIPSAAADELDDISPGRSVFRWRGADSDQSRWIDATELRPGDVVVVPADRGGCDRFGWAPGSRAWVEDLALAAALAADRPSGQQTLTLRLHPGLLRDRLEAEPGPEGETAPKRRHRIAQAFAQQSAALLSLLAEVRERPASEIAQAVAGWTIRLALGPSEAHHDAHQALAASLPELRAPQIHFPYDRDGEEAPSGLVMVWPRPRTMEAAALFDRTVGLLAQAVGHLPDSAVEGSGDSPATEEDGLGAASATGAGTLLADHLEHVAAWVDAMAQRLGLAEPLRADLVLAARLHDLGKLDRRFQMLLAGGSPFAWDHQTLRAKSPAGAGRSRHGDPGPRGSGPLGIDDLPAGWRHEVLSTQLAPLHPAFQEAHDPALVLWLVGTHHGLGRPFFGHLDPAADQGLPTLAPLPSQTAEPPGVLCLDQERPRLPSPATLAFAWQGQDWAQLFEALSRRYGAWDLAWLETLLRLADHRASAVGDGPQGAAAPFDPQGAAVPSDPQGAAAPATHGIPQPQPEEQR